MAHRRLARIAPDENERHRHVGAAQQAWTSIGRDDLIEELRQKFGDLSDDPPMAET